MRTITVMSGVTTNVASSIQSILGSAREQYVVQIIGTGTYSVVMEGSFDGVNFFTMSTDIASEIFNVFAVPYLRATTSGVSGANVTIYVGV